MGVSILTSLSKRSARCCFCHRAIADGKAVVLLTTDVWVAQEPCEEYEIKAGEVCVDLDWRGQKLSHVGCLQGAIDAIWG